MLPHTTLCDDAFQKFCALVRDDRNKGDEDGEAQLQHFLTSKATVQQVRDSAADLQQETGSKYSSKKIGDKKIISQKWIDSIMGKIGNAITIGDTLLHATPESVGVAWFCVKLELNAIQSNHQLYSLFGSGLTSMTEIMIPIPHHEHNSPMICFLSCKIGSDTGVDPIGRVLRSMICQVYKHAAEDEAHDQDAMFDAFRDVIERIAGHDRKVTVRVLASCRSNESFAIRVFAQEARIDIAEGNSGDMASQLSAALARMPDWTVEERGEAKAKLLSMAGSRFGYISAIAISFLQQPFQRPLTRRLENLPEGATDSYK
ncbi:hypothetical protein MBLNU13_g01668t3 [Cladosporium sp. NU13]